MQEQYAIVRVQDRECSWIVYYDGRLHMSLITTGIIFKVGKNYLRVKDVIIDLKEDSNPVVLLVDKIESIDEITSKPEQSCNNCDNRDECELQSYKNCNRWKEIK